MLTVLLLSKGTVKVLILRMVLDNGLLNVLTVFAPQEGNRRKKKKVFGMMCSVW